jgi:phosphopantetheinyl transferase
MTSDDCALVNGHFNACAREVTPAPARHTAYVLYAPVSRDPAVSGRCASVLSQTERQRADRFAADSNKSQFEQRRAFRRFCGAMVLGSSQPLSQIVFEETENGRPHLSELPDLWFSFSSCRFGFLGAWSSTHGVGVDLEDQTGNFAADDLAHRFFSVAEADSVDGVGGLEQQRTFCQFWCLKEAALKAIGEGLPYGLDAFEFGLTPDPHIVHAPPDHGGPQQFDAHVIEGTDCCAALVTRRRTEHSVQH